MILNEEGYKTFCREYERWMSGRNSAAGDPSFRNRIRQQVPQVSIAQTYLKIMNRFSEQFGLTPASISRIVADTGGGGMADEMEDILNG